MEYFLMQPPFKFKSFRDMSKKEAKAHYDWFLSEIPSRLDLLEKVYRATSKEEGIVLDYSPESLIKLWGWYIRNAEIEEKSEELKKLEMEQRPEWMRSSLRSQKISTGWMAIAMDIAIYFAELFIKEHETMTWGLVFKPKRLAYVNKPILIDFTGGIEIDPVHLLVILTFKLLSGNKDENALLKIYNVWSEELS